MRVGVIGVGSMGQNHVRVYSEIAEIVGIADPDVKAGGLVSNRFNVSYFTSPVDLLKEELDAVSVCVPTEHHAKVALDVIRAGVPLLVEKPLAATIAEASKVVDAAESAGVTLAVGHIERHNPAIAAVKRHLQEGQYGDLVTATARRVSSFPGRVRDIGVVMDLGVHEIDVLRFLVGSPVESVFALGGRKLHGNFEDHANVLLRFQNGVHGFVEVNWLTPMKVRRLALTCLKNFVEVDYTEQSVTVSSSTLGPLDPFNLYQIPLEHHQQKIHVRKEEPLRRGGFPPRDPGEAAPACHRGGCGRHAAGGDRRDGIPPDREARAAHVNSVANSELALSDPAVHESRFHDFGPREHVSAVYDHGATHRPLERLEVQLAVRVVGGHERDAIRASDGGL